MPLFLNMEDFPVLADLISRNYRGNYKTIALLTQNPALIAYEVR